MDMVFCVTSFIVTFSACAIFYYKTRKTLKKYEKEFAKGIEELSSEKKNSSKEI